jgi:transposase
MRYSKGIRQEVFIKYVCGYTPKEIAEESGIHFVMIYRWINNWKQDLDSRQLTDLLTQDIGAILTHSEELKRKLDEAECSLSIIHTSRILQTIPLRQRISIALPLLNSYPAKFLSQAFEVSLSSIYYHKRQGQRKAKRQKQDEYIGSKIQEIFTESDGRIGAERVRILLHNQGVIVSKKKIIRFMK